MKAIASIFFLSCGHFTLTLLLRHFLGLDVDAVALTLASVLFGTWLYFLGRMIIRRKRSSAGSSSQRPPARAR